MRRIRDFVKEWQDVLLWIPAFALLLVVVTYTVRWFDPRAGVDGLGFLQGYTALLLKGVLVTFMAWLSKRTYTVDRSDTDEATMGEAALEGRWIPLAIDRLEWLLWLGLWYLVLSG